MKCPENSGHVLHGCRFVSKHYVAFSFMLIFLILINNLQIPNSDNTQMELAAHLTGSASTLLSSLLRDML